MTAVPCIIMEPKKILRIKLLFYMTDVVLWVLQDDWCMMFMSNSRKLVIS